MAGAINVLGGGGSFITFPTLLALGVPPVLANATSTVGLWPAALAGAGAMRADLKGERKRLRSLAPTSAVGGIFGAWLLLHIPSDLFVHLLPALLGVATLIFAFGKRLTARLHGAGSSLPIALAIQLVIAIYGGFYGGGIGIMMLAGLALAGMEDMHAMNAVKNVLATLVNGVAVAVFAYAGAVAWPVAGVMALGAVSGGFLAGRYARRLDPALVRAGVIALGAGLTVFFLCQR